MAYILDRDAAARRLGVSTRTIDRHIQSERIRTRRIWKKIFLEEDDVESLRLSDPARKDEDYIVILKESVSEDIDPTPEIMESIPSKGLQDIKSTERAIAEFSRIYSDAQNIIEKKESVIKDLSYKLGKIEYALENSIDVWEYKRATYLLESVKNKNEIETQVLNEKVSLLEKEVQKRNSALAGMVILFVLVITTSLVFLLWDRLV